MVRSKSSCSCDGMVCCVPRCREVVTWWYQAQENKGARVYGGVGAGEYGDPKTPARASVLDARAGGRRSPGTQSRICPLRKHCFAKRQQGRSGAHGFWKHGEAWRRCGLAPGLTQCCGRDLGQDWCYVKSCALRCVAQSLNLGECSCYVKRRRISLGQVLSLCKTLGSARSSGPRHDEGAQGALGTTAVRLNVVPAPNALADLVPTLLCCALLQPVLDPADPNVLHLIALQPRDRAAMAPRLTLTSAGAPEGS
jgi:hypothetical protein